MAGLLPSLASRFDRRIQRFDWVRRARDAVTKGADLPIILTTDAHGSTRMGNFLTRIALIKTRILMGHGTGNGREGTQKERKNLTTDGHGSTRMGNF
jgi:hypothetical protein